MHWRQWALSNGSESSGRASWTSTAPKGTAAPPERIVHTRPTVRLARCQREFVELHWERAVAAGQVAEYCAPDVRKL